ncbi:MAG: hypothetical protein AAF559_10930 [Pseudomonadota bacterium]
MSGLNRVTRTLLRLADWIAGPLQSEWTAAMAAETDAAGAQGIGWAIGCVGAAFTMRVRADWLRILLLALLPVGASLTEHILFFPAALAHRADWIGVWAIVALPVIPTLAMIFFAGWSSARGSFPFVLALYLLFMLEAFPLFVFFVLTGSDVPISAFFQPDATHWLLPAYFGIALSLSVYLATLTAGFAFGRRRRT